MDVLSVLGKIRHAGGVGWYLRVQRDAGRLTARWRESQFAGAGRIARRSPSLRRMVGVVDARVDLRHKRGHNHVRKVRHGKIKRKGGNGEDEDAGVDRSWLLLPAVPPELRGCAGAAWWRRGSVDGGK